VPGSEVTAGKLGFVVAPRINAAGRIGESADALRLLLTSDALQAAKLAQQLDETNRTRQEEDKRTLSEALILLEESYDPVRDRGVVLAAEGWHPGVIGIVASRLVERIHRPVVLLALDGDRGRGSARSIPGFDLFDALQQCAEHMLRFGGHHQAAGMDVATSSVAALRDAFAEVARARLDEEDLSPVLRADLAIDLEAVDLQLVHWLDYLGPHGMGNPAPTFLARDVTLERAKVVGENHLKATLRQGRASVDAIGFRLADEYPPERVSEGRYDAAIRLERNEFRGSVRVQARLLGIRPWEPVT
jgi:single-stranded-DNA-specific exonuclease